MKSKLNLAFGIVLAVFVTWLLTLSVGETTYLDETPPSTPNATEQVTYPDWTLKIPEIDFTQQMTQITKQGKILPVPDDHPGYYLPNPSHIFIVGHNNSVFPRLKETPSYIQIYFDNSPRTYHLAEKETKLVEDISMDSLFKFNGVVIMTCSGNNIDGKYTHRLILYYT